jgi:hypothetical protein
LSWKIERDNIKQRPDDDDSDFVEDERPDARSILSQSLKSWRLSQWQASK